MTSLTWILGSTFLISVIAWIGVLTFFLKDELLERILLVLVALSAGALTGGAFLHLLPEAVAMMGVISPVKLFLPAIVGFCVLFALEQFIHWHHHHSATHDREPFSYLILISDGLHNFIDGLVIAGSFLVGFQLGVVTALVVALHEIPQEIGDFGVLVYGGFERFRALVLNYLSALTVVVGGVVGYYLSGAVEGTVIYILPFAAGNFIYIAASGLIPEIKKTKSWKKSAVHFTVFVLGILAMLGIKIL